ncbi:hypothetical protein D3C86_1425380 [compost metagenome]
MTPVWIAIFGDACASILFAKRSNCSMVTKEASTPSLPSSSTPRAITASSTSWCTSLSNTVLVLCSSAITNSSGILVESLNDTIRKS